MTDVREQGNAADVADSGPPGDPESVARIICLRALTRQARTRSELAALLARKGVPDDAAHAVLDRFTEVGLIDDAALAAAYSELAHGGRGLSRRAVAATLRRRGVGAEAVESAVSAIDGVSERAAAFALASRKAATLRGVAPDAQARRIVGLLARRGYPAGLAYSVAREVLAEARLPEAGGFDDD
jgi:regulatory protein